MIAVGSDVVCVNAAGTEHAALPPLVVGFRYRVTWSGIADDIGAPAINVVGADHPTVAYRADRFEVAR